MAESPNRSDIKLSRKRILLVFLLIRHAGAKLSEVLHLNPSEDIDYKRHIVRLCKGGAESGRPCREVEISEALSAEVQKALDDAELKRVFDGLFWVDPGHVRRKFYERAESIGIHGNGAPLKQYEDLERLNFCRATCLYQLSKRFLDT